MNRAIFMAILALMVILISQRSPQDHGTLANESTTTNQAQDFMLKLERGGPALASERGSVVINITTTDVSAEGFEELGFDWVMDFQPELESDIEDL